MCDSSDELFGKPVAVSETLMRLAITDEVEIEGWLDINDAIPIETGAAVTLHLAATPFAPVRGNLISMAYAATERPDGSWAYRFRAEVMANGTARLGAKGVVRLGESWVPAGYWTLRRPLSWLRQYTGL
jgi:hypothetical protein